MTPLHQLADRVRQSAPGATINFDPPYHPTGFHDINIQFQGHYVAVRWRDDIAFNVCELFEDDDDAAFDSVPGLVRLETLDAALDHVLMLLHTPPTRTAVSRWAGRR